MDAEFTGSMSDRSYFDRLETAECRLRRLRYEAEHSWTPGQALGEILDYLDRIEGFTDSNFATFCVQKRMQWLTEVLHAGLQRALAIGLDAERLKGVFDALSRHDVVLNTEQAVTAPSVKDARDLIRFEISYLTSSKQER